MTFKQWVLQFVNEDSPRGDLAVDIQNDKTFPNSSSYNEMYDYLYHMNVSDPCLHSFDMAWNDYREIK